MTFSYFVLFYFHTHDAVTHCGVPVRTGGALQFIMEAQPTTAFRLAAATARPLSHRQQARQEREQRERDKRFCRSTEGAWARRLGVVGSCLRGLSEEWMGFFMTCTLYILGCRRTAPPTRTPADGQQVISGRLRVSPECDVLQMR